MSFINCIQAWLACYKDKNNEEDNEFFLRLTLNTGEIIEIPGSGIANVELTEFYKNSIVKAESGTLCTGFGSRLFSSCENLVKVKISDTVTSIGHACFNNCQLLSDINLPNSIETIGDYCFNDCHSITEITLPNKLQSTSDHLFARCVNLRSITIPESVTSFGNESFQGTFRLESINISSLEQWCTKTMENGAYTNPLRYAKYLYLNGQLIENLVIPDSVTKVGYRSFEDYESLRSVIIHDNVTEISRYAFSGCPNLKYVIIGSGINAIYYDSFLDTPNLEYIIINSIVPPYKEQRITNNQNTIFYVPDESYDLYLEWGPTLNIHKISEKP